MARRWIAILCVLGAWALLAGCSTGVVRTNPSRLGAHAVGRWKTWVIPPPGILFSSVSAPAAPIQGNLPLGREIGSRVGRASAWAIGLPPLPFEGLKGGLDLFAWGDASKEQAMSNGGIREARYMDYHGTVVLMVFRKLELVVYGE